MANHSHDPFGRSQLPPARDEVAEREQAAQWFAEVTNGLLYGTPISNEARFYVGGAHRAWLEDGCSGDLVGEYLHLRPRRGSHRTAAELLRRLRGEQDPPSSG